MTTSKITLSELTGIKLIEPALIDEIGWKEPRNCIIRIWVNGSVICLFIHNWSEIPICYILDMLEDYNGYKLRPEDSLRDLGPKNGFRDIYLQSTLLEKLYG